MNIQDIELRWLGHSSFRISFKNRVIFIDPYQLTREDKADIILITHSHYDHCSLADIEKIAKDGTVIVCTADSQSKVTRVEKKIEIALIEPGKELVFRDMKIKASNAYNNTKQFHPKSEGWVGYILQFNNTILYHAGDTDSIKEMQELTGYGKKNNFFIALLPIGGTYTMNAEEAAKAALLLKPSLAIPIHWGSIVGSRQDAEKFVDLCKKQSINATILEKG
jgi:L-ascorbate metabolism protein UlaG (beta-lactamase superfamily)